MTQRERHTDITYERERDIRERHMTVRERDTHI